MIYSLYEHWIHSASTFFNFMHLDKIIWISF